MAGSPKTRTRRRGKGSLQDYNTSAGTRWRFQIRVPIDPEQPELGSKKYSRGGFKTADDADDAMQEALRKKKNQEKFSGKVPRIGVYANDWVEALDLADSTIKGYKKIINNHITPDLGDIRLDLLTATRIARHYKELKKSGRKDKGHEGEPLSANTVHKTHVVLGAILDAAIEDGHIPLNPAKKRKTVKAPRSKDIKAARPEVTTWSGEDLHTVLSWLRNTRKDEFFALWRVIAYTGMRRSEALALRWRDIDIRTKRISIRRAVNTVSWSDTKPVKTGSPRVIDVDDDTLKILATHKAARAQLQFLYAKPDAFIFGDDAGLLRSPDSVTSLWARRLDWVIEKHPDIERVNLKGLRHTHATLLLELGVHPKVVQERLGHSTITTTMNIYSHVTPTMQRSAIDGFANHVSNQ